MCRLVTGRKRTCAESHPVPAVPREGPQKDSVASGTVKHAPLGPTSVHSFRWAPPTPRTGRGNCLYSDLPEVKAEVKAKPPLPLAPTPFVSKHTRFKCATTPMHSPTDALSLLCGNKQLAETGRRPNQQKGERVPETNAPSN